MNDRDYLQLFAYFVGARGNHAVHVRALLHAGFDVEADTETTNKSYVKNPATGETVGVIVGEPDAVIGYFRPPAASAPPVKTAGKKIQGTGV